MDAWREALLTGDLLQKGTQAAAFIAVKHGEKRILVLTRNLAYAFQDFDAILCQMQRIQAAVIGIRLPLYETSLLEVVQYGNQPAGMNLQSGRECLLTDAG
jgi:hypothetical protein